MGEQGSGQHNAELLEPGHLPRPAETVTLRQRSAVVETATSFESS